MGKGSIETPRLEWLTDFREVAGCHSYAIAGERLGYNPTTVSRRIQNLGLWLGKPLIRGRRELHLTDDGQQFCDVAHELSLSLLSFRLDSARMPQGKLRFAWLDAFIAVAKRKKHLEVAAEYGWDQTTVTRFVNHLQCWLGYRLIKQYRPVRLTRQGKKFLKVARKVVTILDQCRSGFAGMRSISSNAASKRRLGKSATLKEYNDLHRMRTALDRQANAELQKHLTNAAMRISKAMFLAMFSKKYGIPIENPEALEWAQYFRRPAVAVSISQNLPPHPFTAQSQAAQWRIWRRT